MNSNLKSHFLHTVIDVADFPFPDPYRTSWEGKAQAVAPPPFAAERSSDRSTQLVPRSMQHGNDMLQARRFPHARLGPQHGPLQIFDFHAQLASRSHVVSLQYAACENMLRLAQSGQRGSFPVDHLHRTGETCNRVGEDAGPESGAGHCDVERVVTGSPVFLVRTIDLFFGNFLGTHRRVHDGMRDGAPLTPVDGDRLGVIDLPVRFQVEPLSCLPARPASPLFVKLPNHPESSILQIELGVGFQRDDSVAGGKNCAPLPGTKLCVPPDRRRRIPCSLPGTASRRLPLSWRSSNRYSLDSVSDQVR